MRSGNWLIAVSWLCWFAAAGVLALPLVQWSQLDWAALPVMGGYLALAAALAAVLVGAGVFARFLARNWRRR